MMQKVLQRILSLFTKTDPPRKGHLRKTKAQSLVEVAIAFPVLIVLFSGVIEFGFILNYYLSLLDATRESARYWSNDDPFLADGVSDDPTFYYETAVMVRKILDPSLTYTNPSDYKGRRIALDPSIDDVIVTVYGAKGNIVTLWRDGGPYHLLPTNGSVTGNYPSIFNVQAIKDTRVATAPNAGILVVEVHYNYHHILSLPWLTAWLPNPLHLRAYTIMPIRTGEPQ
jgi:hypothetical protein